MNTDIDTNVDYKKLYEELQIKYLLSEMRIIRLIESTNRTIQSHNDLLKIKDNIIRIQSRTIDRLKRINYTNFLWSLEDHEYVDDECDVER